MKLTWMLLPLLLAEPARVEYKCWIEDSGGRERILFYLWQPQQARREQALLPGRPLVDSPHQVVRVMECQSARVPFQSPRARALEQLTPR